MWKLLLGIIKKQITSPVKAAKKLFKVSKKKAKKGISAPARSIRAKVKKGRRLGRLIKFASPKQRLIEDTYKKARIITALTDEINLKLEKKTSTTVTSSETAKDISSINKFLKGKKADEIRSYNKSMTKELEKRGLDSDEKINRVVEEAEFKQDIVNTNSYESFMDNWKDGFFGYKPEELGMTEDERNDVWDQIEEKRTFEDFVERKLS